MKNELKLSPCDCGERQVAFERVRYGRHQAVCLSCKKRGRPAYKMVDAAKAWNSTRNCKPLPASAA